MDYSIKNSGLRLVLSEIVGAVKFDGFALGYSASTGQPLWAIRRQAFDANTGVTTAAWANQGNAVSIWDARTSYFPAPPAGSWPGELVYGNFSTSPGGLRNAGRVTEVTINNNTWTALPATPIALRNAISIQNISGQEIKVNYDPTVSGYVGIVIATGNERFYDITDAIPIYAKSSASSCSLNIEELS